MNDQMQQSALLQAIQGADAQNTAHKPPASRAVETLTCPNCHYAAPVTEFEPDAALNEDADTVRKLDVSTPEDHRG